MDIIYKEIEEKHNLEVKQVITQVGIEFGAVGEGYGPSDLEVNQMSQFYSDDLNSFYIVALLNNSVVGGCGIAPFNSSKEVCELKKLFLLPESRGFGVGKECIIRCLNYAKAKGFTQCYLDTLSNMESAISLYSHLGFKHLTKPLDGTIHNKCDIWMIKDLNNSSF